MVKTFLRAVMCACLFFAPLLLVGSPRAFGQVTNPFFTPPTFTGSGQAISADVNGDGKPDLLFFDGTVLLGKGDGTFTTGTAWRNPATSPTLTASQFAIADFNGDGKPDILVAGPLNLLSVSLGNGDGTFQAPVTTSIAAPATTFVVGDLNGDGKPDVLAQVGSAFFSYLGKGDGTFGAGVSSNATSASVFDSLVDFNGNGKADLFVFNQAVLQIGNGDGTFQTPSQLPFGMQPLSGILGDFDGDGKLDIMGFFGSSSTQQVQILFGNGDGTFRAGAMQPFTASLSDLTVVDLNGDGKADFVGSTGSALQVLIGKGDGTFTPDGFYNAPSVLPDGSNGSNSIVIADFNGDKKKDVAVFNTMLLGNGDGTLQGDGALPGSFGNYPVAGDFNGDGHPDFASISAGTTNSSVNLNSWINDGNANFTLAHTSSITIPSPGFDSAGIVSLNSAVDLNGDGKLDLIGYIWDGGGLKLMTLLGNGDGSFDAPVTLSLNSDPLHVDSAFLFVADLNGDGKPDIVVTTSTPDGGSFYVLLGNGDGTFGTPSMPFVGNGAGIVALGDFNNDKKIDAILGTSNGIGVLLGNGDGTFQPVTFITTAACGTSCGDLVSGDFNGDGNLDLMVQTGAGYQVLLGKGDGTFNISPEIDAAARAFQPGQVADFNGDGYLDVLGSFPSTSSLSLLLGNGDGTFGSPFTLPNAGVQLVADFNGDNKLDILEVGQNQLVWLFNGSGPNFSMSAGTGASVTVAAGKTASYSLSLGGSGGFSGSVALTCGGAPTGANCTISPSSLTLSGTTPQSAMVSITTTAASQLPPSAYFDRVDPVRRIVWIFGLLILAGIATALVAARTSQRRFSYSFSRLLAAACCALVLISASLMAGCGGGSSSSSGSGGSGSGGSGSGTGGATGGTATGTYTITVTATSQSPSVTRTTKLTLIVQ